MDSISNEEKITHKFPSVLILLALILGVGFAFSLLFLRSPESAGGSEIRIVNDSDFDFIDVVVGGVNYGNIGHRQVTGYHHWKTAYRYSSVSLKAAGKEYSLQPTDYVGEKPLGYPGKFSYLLKFGASGEIEMEVRGDEG